MSDQEATRRLVGPPNSWSGCREDTAAEDVAAADARHDVWMASPAGQTFAAADLEIVNLANAKGIDYRAAMRELGYVAS